MQRLKERYATHVCLIPIAIPYYLAAYSLGPETSSRFESADEILAGDWSAPQKREAD